MQRKGIARMVIISYRHIFEILDNFHADYFDSLKKIEIRFMNKTKLFSRTFLKPSQNFFMLCFKALMLGLHAAIFLCTHVCNLLHMICAQICTV